METSNNKLEPLSIASDEIQRQWILGGISELTGIPKKSLRSAFSIVSAPRLKAEIIRNDKVVKKTFCYGFMSYVSIKKEKKRKILEPHPEVQKVYAKIKVWLGENFSSHERAFGFVQSRNTKGATETLRALFSDGQHFGFDIADAFPSITDKMVSKSLKNLGVEEPIAEVLAWFVTYKYQGKRRLPQGASSSPILLNLVYVSMCNELNLVCKKNNIDWSTYVDDFNFSSKSISEEIKKELSAIPIKFDFKIKPEKTKDNLGKTIPHLLGLTIVEGKIHINRKQKKKFRRIFFAAMKHDAYPTEVVHGIMRYIGHIYGKKENWPGWLKKIGSEK